ncbi:hypothetical protein EOD39_6974 [Acipenser ruthenus]|uniref:Uncharacterized protein n=1 Tax=Acipenser ruthenus TaxID=7906 RepID=A0A444U8G3_ACIRT|nr:hypothetical protein EOD39_6974 [Acipenser ruthenus]
MEIILRRVSMVIGVLIGEVGGRDFSIPRGVMLTAGSERRVGAAMHWSRLGGAVDRKAGMDVLEKVARVEARRVETDVGSRQPPLQVQSLKILRVFTAP